MRKKRVIFTIVIFILIQGIASAEQITVSTISELKDALDYAEENPGTIIELESGTYNVNPNELYVPSDTEITGESDTIIKLQKQDRNYPTPDRCRAIFNARGSSTSGITFSGFTIDGNSENDWSVWGNDHINMIQLFGTSNVDVHDMTFKNGLGDAVKVRHGSSDSDQDKDTNIKIYNNVIDRIGHDGIYLFCVNDAEIYGNTITCRDDSGIRIFNSNNIKIHDNDITSKNQGGAGIEIQKNEEVSMDNIEIYNNKIYHIRNSGIWCYGYEESGADTSYIYIHDNEISDCALNAGGGVSIQAMNVFLEENTIKDNRNYDVGILNCWKSFKGSGYKIALDSNDLSKDVFNQLSGTHSITYSSEGVKPDKDIVPPKDDDTDNGNGEGEDEVKVIPPKDNTTDNDNGDNEVTDVEPANKEEDAPDSEDIDPVETFNSIFDVMQMNFYDTAGSSYYIVLPENTGEIPTGSTWTIEQHNDYALVYGPTTGLVSVHCRYAGKEGIHTTMIGERTGWRMVYNNVSIWSGDISRLGESFHLDGAVDPDEVQLTCFTPKGSFEPQKTVIEVEDEESGSIFNKFLFFYLSVLLILLSVPIMVVIIIFSKRNFF